MYDLIRSWVNQFVANALGGVLEIYFASVRTIDTAVAGIENILGMVLWFPRLHICVCVTLHGQITSTAYSNKCLLAVRLSKR